MTWPLRRERRLPVTVTIDADNPEPKEIAGYLAEIAARLDERPERMRVRFVSPCGVSLDIVSDGRLSICVAGRRPYRFSLRRRWIADHSVPLELKDAVLLVDPVDAGRFRVRARRGMLARWL